jgi:REP element-mobilizing transposase RayT
MMLRKYEYRRRLPHYQSDLKAIFVTFATHQRRILSPIARTICLDICIFGNGKRFTLHGVVIMPDHVHIVFTPLFDENGFFSVAEIMQGIKGASAHRINYALGRSVARGVVRSRITARGEDRGQVGLYLCESEACRVG